MNDRLAADALDSLIGYESRPVRRYSPMPTKPIAGTWAPKMTPEEKAAHDKYVADEGLPF